MHSNQVMAATPQGSGPMPQPGMSDVCNVAGSISTIADDILIAVRGLEARLIGGDDKIEKIEFNGQKDNGAVGFLFDRQMETAEKLCMAAQSMYRITSRL